MGGNGSGNSWANAAVSLADALSWARTNEGNWAGDSLRIYVAKGTYLPKYKADDNTLSANNRDNAFVMVKNVQIYGGFPNGGSTFAVRDWNANPTLMSGDIGTAGNASDNAYHVIVVAGNAGNACVDGFVVKDGRADGSGPITVNSQSVDRGVGGGLVSEQSNLKIRNSIFTDNYAMHGGGYLTNSSTLNFTNCKIKNNTTQYNGAGMYHHQSSITQLINTEISGNSAIAGNGGAMQNYGATVTLRNCLVAKNNALNGGGIWNELNSLATLINVSLADNTPNAYALSSGSSFTAKNSIVLGGKNGDANTGTYQNSYVDGASWNGNWGTNGGSNIVSINDPFINKATSDYRLSPCALAVDAGSNTLYTGGGGNLSTDKDIVGNNRVFNTTIDMGAFENILPILTPPTVNLGPDISACNDTILNAGNPGMAYLWSNNSTNQTLAVSASGTYWVKVTDPNTGCSNTDDIVVNLTDAGHYTVSPVSDTICIGESVLLQCTSGNVITYCTPIAQGINHYEWITNVNYAGINNSSGTFGVPAYYTSMIASVTVGLSNTLSVSIKADEDDYLTAWIDWNQNGVLNDAGETYVLATSTSSAGPHNISIIPPNSAYNGITRMRIGLYYNQPYPIPCQTYFYGETEDYSVHVSGGVNKILYNWTDGNSTISTNSSVTVSPTVSTSYYLTATTPNCQKTREIPIVVNALPIINLGADDAYCAGTPYSNVLDAGNSGSTYLWSDNTSYQTLTVSASGTYSVTVTDGNGCVNADTITVVENALPVVNLGADDAYCAGTPYTLDAGNNGSTYLWSDNTSDQTLTVSASGTYSVSVTDGNGCVNADTITIVENALPIVNLGADGAYCAGTPYSNVLDAGNSGSTYLWSDNTTNQTLAVSASGTYSVSVTDGNGCVNADTITIVENALPIITVTQNGNELTADESATGTTDLWIDCANNTPITGQTLQQFTSTQNGNYAVVVTSQEGCSDTSACISITNVGINENAMSNGVSIYPNPTSGSVTVNTDKIYKNLTVKISDVSGKVLSIETVQNTQKALININGSKGVYFIHIYTDKEMLSLQRVIKY